jgi:biotin transporter BioY
MRGTIGTIFGYAGFICSFLIAVYVAYWIWELDWGVSTRGRALMFMAMVFAPIIVFFAGYFASLYASVAIGGDS